MGRQRGTTRGTKFRKVLCVACGEEFGANAIATHLKVCRRLLRPAYPEPVDFEAVVRKAQDIEAHQRQNAVSR